MNKINTAICKIHPQPRGLMYVIGNERWKPINERSQIRLAIEDWSGDKVKFTEIFAPIGAFGVEMVKGEVWWSKRNVYGDLVDE